MKGKHCKEREDNIKRNEKNMQETAQKKNKMRKGRRVVLSLLQLFFLGAMIFSGIKIYNWYMENLNTQKQIEEIKNNIKIDNNEYKIDFKALKQKNSDTVGWIKVENTKIEYPIVQTEDNEYYLQHGFDKEYNSAGWAFMDYRNKNDGTDKNMIIYGHNRRDDSIFGTLKNILEPEWYNNKENKYVTYANETGTYKYEVFSVYQIENEEYYITTSFNNKEFETFISTIKNRSIIDFGVDVSKDDDILTLSSCANDNKYRVVLHAKK